MLPLWKFRENHSSIFLYMSVFCLQIQNKKCVQVLISVPTFAVCLQSLSSLNYVCCVSSAPQGMSSVYFNKGENCIAAGRLFVEESIHDEYISRVVSTPKH